MGEHGKPFPILGVEKGRKERPAQDMAINRAEPRCGRLSGGPVRVDGFGWSCSGSSQQTIDRQAQDRGDAEQHQHEQPWRDVVQHGFSSAFRDPFVVRLDRFRRPESLPRSFGSSPMSWRPPTTLFPQPSGLPFHCRMRKSRARLQLKNIAIFRTKTGLGSTSTKGGPRNPAGHSTSDNKSRHLACNRPNISNPSPESPSLSPIPGADARRGASRQAACPRCPGFVAGHIILRDRRRSDTVGATIEGTKITDEGLRSMRWLASVGAKIRALGVFPASKETVTGRSNSRGPDGTLSQNRKLHCLPERGNLRLGPIGQRHWQLPVASHWAPLENQGCTAHSGKLPNPRCICWPDKGPALVRTRAGRKSCITKAPRRRPSHGDKGHNFLLKRSDADSNAKGKSPRQSWQLNHCYRPISCAGDVQVVPTAGVQIA